MSLFEDVFHQVFYSIRTVAFTPVVAVADHNTDFRFTAADVDIIIRAITDMLAVQRIDTVATTGQRGITQLSGILRQKLGKAHI